MEFSAVKCIFLLLITLILTACNEGQSLSAEEAERPATTTVKIALDQPITALIESSPLPFDKDCLQPVRMCWYEIKKRFAEQDLPAVEISQNGSNLLQLEDVGRISVVVEEARGRLVEQVTLGIRGLPDNSPHAEQKAFIYQLLNTLLSSGWTHFYRFPAARIPGSEADKIATADKIQGKRVLGHPWFDPRYEPASMGQWLRAAGTYHWYFHQDNIYLHVTVRRSNSRSEPAERGTYLINLEVLNENAYWSQHFKEEDQKDWLKLLPGLLEQYRNQRAQLETEAQAEGIEIEDSYQDPIIKALGQ